MELQLHVPFHPPEPPPPTAFDFGFHIQHTVGSSRCSSPASSAGYLSAPSSPPSHSLNLCFYSAPASPTAACSSSTIIPFNWEAIPGVPKPFNSESDSAHCNLDDDNDDFEFDFSGQLVNHPPSTISAADELFHGGKIRPLKPPPGLQPNTIAHTHHYPPTNAASPPRFPRSPVAKFRGAFSPRRRKEEQEREKGFLDPFETALERTRKSDFSAVEALKNNAAEQRGRTVSKSSNSNNPRKGISRSLSPLRVTEFALLMQQQQQQQEEEDERHQDQTLSRSNYGSYSSTSSSSSSSSWSKSYRKWRLKDFFLFRSASEGRATGKSDPLKKYYHNTATIPPQKVDVVVGSSSNLSDLSVGSTSSRRRTAPAMSCTANEVPYTANRNRLISEELQKKKKKKNNKTSLPYKYGLLGCIGFNPVIAGFGFQDVSSRGFSGSSYSSLLRQ